ncbi:MAG: ABC transporter permease [Bacteroidales bacterium]|jgi:putative ABC transport system permease protein|nr:ABC transporter permease [Bacteroidales bacterium]
MAQQLIFKIAGILFKSITMLKNYIKTAFRNLFRNRFYALINIIGLSIGLSISLLILFYVSYELSFDKFHSQKENIYRLNHLNEQPNESTKHCISMPVIGPDVAEEFPEVKHFVRFMSPREGFFTYDEKNFNATNLTYSDSALFDVFDFNLLQGNPETALNDPFCVVLTQSLANKIFNGKNPVGEFITLNKEHQYKVTGIIDDFPHNSHLQFSAIFSFSTLYQTFPKYHFNWNGGWSYYTYFLLENNTNPDELEQKLRDFYYEKINKRYEKSGWKVTPFVQPLTDIYLSSELMYDSTIKGNLKSIYIFSVIAILILILAGINFTNLTTALSLKRVKEVGVRKVAGANNRKIRTQFLSEAIFITCIAFIIAVILIEVMLPHFNQLLGKQIKIYTSSNLPVLLLTPGLVFIIGIVSGSYPAFYISRLNLESVAKGKIRKNPKRASLKSILTVIQFFISIGLIIASIIIYQQLNYIQQRDPGYNSKNLMVLPLKGSESLKNKELLKEQMIRMPQVKTAGLGSNYPGRGVTSNGYIPEGSDKPMMFNALYVDEDYIPLFEFGMKEGRNFNPDMQTDQESCMVNETLVHVAGWENPLGKVIERNGVHYQVIGVVKDFNFSTVYQPIEPLIFTQQDYADHLFLRFASDAPNIMQIQNVWDRITGNEPFEYFFLDDQYQIIYRSEIQFGNLVLTLTILAILIASLGILGLTTLSTELRTKEIGIRKVLGAKSGSILKLIIVEYSKWVLLANILAWPVAYYLLRQWLQQFVYRTDITLSSFIISGLIAYLIAIATISYRALKVSNLNPVHTLRYE